MFSDFCRPVVGHGGCHDDEVGLFSVRHTLLMKFRGGFDWHDRGTATDGLKYIAGDVCRTYGHVSAQFQGNLCQGNALFS